MSEIINTFPICSEISVDLKQKIKLFHIFDDINGFNVLFVTIDDQVYGYGQNTDGCCGLGHTNVVKIPQLIPELCNKNIKMFFVGYAFVLALTEDNKLFGWGRKGIGYYEKVRQIPFPKKTIVQIACGYLHALVLTNDGSIYVWGSNQQGQLGIGKTYKFVSDPKLMKFFSKTPIKYIHTSNMQSFAITSEGKLFTWGYNDYFKPGHVMNPAERIFTPEEIAIDQVKEISSSNTNTYFLTEKGSIYFCGKAFDMFNNAIYEKTPKMIENYGNDLDYLKTYEANHISYKSLAFSITKNTLYILDSNRICKTKYQTPFDFISNEYKITGETIRVEQTIVNHILVSHDKDDRQNTTLPNEEQEDMEVEDEITTIT